MPQPAQNPPRRENRLARSGSPYLLQHRLNPVDWFPWGQEAFEAARRREVPIFLSIGYSTCYWCHVMERESFENNAIAALMNENFVCIKIDREERPDVDDIYMAAVQAFRGQGGWPMSVFLEPRTLKPFWAGTYFPAEPSFQNIPTFPQVLQGIAAAWKQQQSEVVEQAEHLAAAVKERIGGANAPVQLGVAQVTQAVAQLLKIHDPVQGGFGSAPKFPQPVYIEFLLDVRLSAADDTRAAIDAALRTTLDQMALGGMFDQVGGGFHRYSVDASWTVPHFEKMLYDNAQLAGVYARAAKVFDDPLYRRTASRTIEYVLREMTLRGDPTEHVGGAFFSAQDAEVHQREGLNYLWSESQVREALDPDDAELALRVYSLDKGPNFRDPHHPNDAPMNVLRWPEPPGNLAAAMNMTEQALLARLDGINARLYAVRQKRDQPSADDKVLTSWNGLMIGAIARAASALERPEFVRAAEVAAEFIIEQSVDGDGGLVRSVRVGSDAAAGRIPAFLEDYACMAHACVELHRDGNDASGRWLERAKGLVGAAEARFGDPNTGAYFDTLADQADLFVRTRSTYDGAMPSGSSVMVNVLIDLFEITGDKRHLDRALQGIRSLSAFLAEAPLGAAGSTRALLRAIVLDAKAVAKVFAGDASAASAEPQDFTAVEIHAAVERAALAKGQPVPIVLRFEIAEGYHINAAEVGESPDAADLIPLRVHIVGGTGVDAFADYPAGQPYGKDGSLRMLSGSFELTVVLERAGEWSGTPLIGVTYQACTEDACLVPRTVELDVAIDPRD